MIRLNSILLNHHKQNRILFYHNRPVQPAQSDQGQDHDHDQVEQDPNASRIIISRNRVLSSC